MNTLKVGVPKGSLQESTISLFGKAGYNITIGSRSYYPQVDDKEIEAMLLRPQEMALYVEKGVIDIGLAGRDWVRECQAEVFEFAEFSYSRSTNKPARWVLAVAEDSPIQNVKDLEGQVIFTELVQSTKKYLNKNNVNAEVRFSHGATEVKIPHLCQAIVELTETGSSLKANHLRIIDTVMESVTTMVVNPTSWKNEWKKTKIENLNMLLAGALKAEGKVGLKMNIENKQLDKLVSILPSMRNPTISSLSQDGWCAVETIIDQHICRDLIPKLRRIGAEGIIEYTLNKVIP
ncbi:ATP phosphoribosyltransferase [Candidatus Poribacteria bacterium]|nr:ATP phosphoribosyltransferase [Candidatus Poribacteria bacterium]